MDRAYRSLRNLCEEWYLDNMDASVTMRIFDVIISAAMFDIIISAAMFDIDGDMVMVSSEVIR